MKEKLIQKWLDNELTKEELETFKNLDEYSSYAKISERAKLFKAPEFDQKEAFKKLDFATNSLEKSNNTSILKYALAIAAVLVIGFSLFKLININQNIQSFETTIAKTETIELPDHSNVYLNSNSSLSYTSSGWDSNRELKLDGEALFEVEKGEKFVVNTNYGNVKVLGTVFNVKSRSYIFEVSCFEGSVNVEHNKKSFVLKENDKLLFENDTIILDKNRSVAPDWKNNQSVFKSATLEVVLEEFKNYYDVEFNTTKIETSKIFTGSFSHRNLEIALNSITLPLGLSYQIDGKTVFLSNK